MRIVITGASGFIGREVATRLLAAGAELLLVGRAPERLSAAFGDGVRVCGYDRLAERARGFDTLVHLAVRNNDQPGDIEAFRDANVTLLATVIEAARQAGVRRFVNITSLKSIGEGRDPYTVSKREADALLATVSDMEVVNIRVAAVYGERFKGTLGILGRVPRPLQRTALNILACAKPVTRIDLVYKAILNHAVAPATGPSRIEMLVTDGQHDNPVYRWIMRGVDLLFCIVILGVLWWFMLGVWIAVKVTSSGPGLFAQRRVGRHERVFTCYKFRSMKADTAQRGTHEISASDVTRIGAAIRRYKIDEFPQALNIALNQLSLVGPRPCLPSQETLVEERRVRGVFAVKGGITGWAQINGVDMSEPARLARLDAEYIARRTVLLDLRIILRTLLGAGRGDPTGR